MLEKWSIAFADRLIRHSPESKMRAEVLAYALGVYLNLAATVLLALAFGLLTGELAQTLTAMLLFNLTRLFTGGFHFKSLGACALASAALYAAIPWFELAAPTASALTVWALAIFLLLAPASAPRRRACPAAFAHGSKPLPSCSQLRILRSPPSFSPLSSPPRP